MKESMRQSAFLLTVALSIASLVSREVAGYPMLESAANNGPYASNGGVPPSLQANPDANNKDLQFPPIPLNAYDNR